MMRQTLKCYFLYFQNSYYSTDEITMLDDMFLYKTNYMLVQYGNLYS